MKPKILFIGEVLTLTHAIRPWYIANQLNPEKYDIFFACAEDMAPLLPAKNPNIKFIKLKTSVSAEEFGNAVAKGQIPHNKCLLQQNIDEELKIMRDVNPDLVIGDFRLSLGISCEHIDIPYICLANLNWSPFYNQGSFGVAPNLTFFKRFPHNLAKLTINTIKPILKIKLLHPLNQIRKAYKLKPFVSIYEAYTYGSKTLYFDLEGLFKTEPLQNHHRIVGPLINIMKSDIPEWVRLIPKDKPWVLVALGSSGPVENLHQILDGLKKLPIYVLIATSGRVKESELPKNTWSSKYLPLKEVLSQCSVFISHGGSSTSYESFAESVPLLSIPSNIDQCITADLYQKSLLGLSLSSIGLSSQKVKELTLRLLNDENIKKNVKQISQKLDASNKETIKNIESAITEALKSKAFHLA